MSKIETSRACIECGNKLLDKIYPMLLEYNDNFDNLSSFEKETYNTIIGSQFALICEYYLKGLVIPNIQVIIPDELKDVINTLNEEQELMIIVSDEEKIKNDPLLNRLDKKQLRLLLNNNSLKSFGHSLIALLGTETLEENKRIVLPKIIRKSIINEMRNRLHNPDNQTFKEKHEFRNYLNTPLQRDREGHLLFLGDKIVEESLSLSSTSEAFPKGRYGIFDGFTSDVNSIAALTFSIRNSIKHQFPNLIEVYKSKNDPFGKFIYPDKETRITIKGDDDAQLEYEMVPEISFSGYGTGIFWNASRIIPTLEELEQLKVLTKYDESARIAHSRIYLDEIAGEKSIEYTQNSQNKQVIIKNGIMYEIVPELTPMKEEAPNNHSIK